MGSPKQLRSQTPLRNAIRQKNAQDVHWWIGFGIERLIFNSPLSSPSAILLLRLRRSEIDAPLNCIASSGSLIRCKGRKLVAVPVVICRLQYFSLSRHYYDGCAAGGLLKKFVEERCPGYDGMTERSASSSRHVARIAPPVYECSEEKRRLTSCQ